MSNTLKTVWGFIISMLAKYTPIKIEGKTLDRIYNYLPIDAIPMRCRACSTIAIFATTLMVGCDGRRGL